jgi:hypothetical protein
MATALEQAFINSVTVASGVRQNAYTAANVAYAGVFANLGTYQAAIVAADVAFMVSVNTAATTAGISPNVVPEMQGMMGGKWASILT